MTNQINIFDLLFNTMLKSEQILDPKNSLMLIQLKNIPISRKWYKSQVIIIIFSLKLVRTIPLYITKIL